MGQEKNSLISEVTHAKKARQVFSYFQENWTSSRISVTWDDKCHNLNVPSFFVPSLLLNVMSCGMEYPFGQYGSVVLAVSPPHLLPTSNPLTGKAA